MHSQDRLSNRKQRLSPSPEPTSRSLSSSPALPGTAGSDVVLKHALAAKKSQNEEKLMFGKEFGASGKDDGVQIKGVKEYTIVLVIFLISLGLRVWNIRHPAAVVFDEVHFGKFASYYLRREFFFDVHPPLAKLILAFAGYVVGYDGHFEFDNIGDSYIENNVPYVALRALPAIFGALIPVVAYGIMRESGYPVVVALLTASLSAVDNAHIVQTRLILLDAPLVFFMAASFYAYIRFYKLRYSEFTRPWWTWMILTGISLALTLSCKMVGLFAFMTVGTAVAVDLWNLLDIKRGLSIEHVTKHFFARAFGLIFVPISVYLFWFWVHFAVLTKSGTGDDFMSPAFQQTLQDSPLGRNAEPIHYYDTITLQHKGTKGFLHSHPDRYPLKYDDGRISSTGQQVTAYPFNDTNNHWIVEPTEELHGDARDHIVRHQDVIMLRHVQTNTTLLTHDVACPTLATNTEFTTWDGEDMDRLEDTLFEVRIDDVGANAPWMTKSSHFQLVHVPLKVAMWTHTDPVLPDWAYKQQEVNGNKNLKDKTTFWIVDEVVRDPNTTDWRPKPAPKERVVKKLGFFRKFAELQVSMLQHNAILTDSHPYASGPINWPFLLSGISFWTGTDEDRKQVYMIGNPISWWLCVMALSVFVGILGADQLAKRRGLMPIPDPTRNRLYNSGGFFMLAWIFHYLPFFSMSRQLFLHHYLPAHLCSTLVTGAVFNFIASETVNFPISVAGPLTRRRPRTYAEISIKTIFVAFAIGALLVAGFLFIAPLTYGSPGLNPEEVNRRRLLSTWTLHYAK